jgi:hypothetical protein
MIIQECMAFGKEYFGYYRGYHVSLCQNSNVMLLIATYKLNVETYTSKNIKLHFPFYLFAIKNNATVLHI